MTQRWWERSPSSQEPAVFFNKQLSLQRIQSQEAIAEDKPYLPNPKLTPGSIFEQATREEICVPGYSKWVRHVPLNVKKNVYRNYGIRHHQPGEYEMDYLISLELGGDNQSTNLWPEPYYGQCNARDKDRLENELHQRVCSGAMSLKQAQQEIATDWVAAYRKYLGSR